MDITRTFRYRLYPDAEQNSLFRRIGGCCRKLKNIFISARKDAYENEGMSLTVFDQINAIPQIKEELPYMKEAPSQVLQQCAVDVGRAYKNFFEGRSGYPKFHKKSDGASFRFPTPGIFRIGENYIDLPKIGKVHIVKHRQIEGKVCNATITSEADQWYVCITCKVELADPIKPTGEDVGIDIGVAKPIVTSDGHIDMLPRTSQKERKKLANLQRSLSRKKKGSKNRAKAKLAVARYHRELARRRKDAANKATTRLAKRHSRIFIEDLKVRNMTASAAGTIEQPGRNVAAKSGLNRSILDVAPYQLRSMLEYKCPWYGSEVHADNPAYTSQECSRCHHTCAANRKNQAEFVCVKCGFAENADFNAAINIKHKGQSKHTSTVGTAGRACESNRNGDRKQETDVERRSSIL